MNAYILPKMTWPEVEEALKTVKVALIPIGAQEQHGHIVAEGCDSYRAEKFSELLAEKCFPNVIVTPTINFGISPHHMDFPGTITLRPETLIDLLEDIVSSLNKHGIKKFLFVNGHGGNNAPMAVAAEKIARKYDVEIGHTLFVGAAKNTIKENIHSEFFGHACEREVSECLYMVPDIVRQDKIEKGDLIDSFVSEYCEDNVVTLVYQFNEVTRNGNLGDATKASYELGEKIIQEALENIAKFINEFIEFDRSSAKNREKVQE